MSLTVIDELAQVETLLKGQDAEPASRTSPPQPLDNPFSAPLQDDSMLSLPELSGLGNDPGNAMPTTEDGMGTSQPSQTLYPSAPPSFPTDPQWDLISLGVEEPLPTQDVVEEL
jgi:hypothetical protein